MADEKIVKLYDLKIQGGQEIIQALDTINNRYIEIKKNKLSLSSVKATIYDSADLAKANKELVDTKLAQQQVTLQLKQQQLELKQLQLLQAKERQERQAAKKDNEALAGSYNEINKKYKELLALSKQSVNLLNPEEVRQAQAELMKYKSLLDNFGRGLTKDGTLVGEYTTGILQAFKQSGLDDVIRNQLQVAKQGVETLDREFEQLKQELKEVQATGGAALQVVEQKLIENRKQAQGFTEQIQRVENEMRTMNQTGGNIASTIGLQFRNLKRDMASFAIGFVGFQAALSKIQGFVGGSVKEFEEAETASARFQNRLKLMGRQGELDALNEQIDLLVQKFPSLDNDDLTNAAEKLVTYGKVSKEQIQQLLPVIVDFAANQQISLQEATVAVIKGLEGSGKAFKEYGLELKETQAGAESFSQIVDVLGSKVRGSAQVFAETATGELAAHRQELRNLQEQLGERLLPVIIQVTSFAAAFAAAIAAVPISALTAGIVGLTAAYTAYRINLALTNKESFIYTVVSKARVIADGIATASTWLLTKATTAARIEFTLFNTAIKISPLGWLLTILGPLVPAMLGMASAFGETAGEMKKVNDLQDDINKAQQEGIKTSAKEVSELDRLYKKTQTLVLSMQDRVKAAEQIKNTYPEAFKNFTAEQIALGKSTEAYNKLRASIIAVATEKALGAKRDAITAPLYAKLADLQIKQQEIENRRGTFSPFTTRETIPGSTKERTRTVSVEEQEATRLAQAQQLAQQVTAVQGDISKVLDNFDNIINKNAQSIIQATTPPPNFGNIDDRQAKGKTTTQKKENRISELEKEYDAEVNVIKEKYTERKITEEQLNNELIEKAVEFKTKRLAEIQKLNKDEQQDEKAFSKTLADDKQQAYDNLYELEQRALERSFKLQQEANRRELDSIENDASLNNEERIAKRIQLNERILQQQVQYNEQEQALELKYNVLAVQAAEDRATAIYEIEKKLGEDLDELRNAQYEKFKQEQQQRLRDIQNAGTRSAIGILTGSGTTAQKERALKQAQRELEQELRDERQTQIDEELLQVKDLYDKKLISQQEYNLQVSDLEQERLQLVREAAESEVDIAREKEQRKAKLEEAGLQIAERAISAYIQNQQAEVEATYKAVQDKLAIQKDERLQRAQSKAEEEAIKKEYEEKEREAERRRNKERQSIARQQLAIEFAVATIKAISTSSNIYEGLAKEAVVLAEYIAALSLLNRQKFYGGGVVKPERLTDGLIKAAPNVAPTPQGDNVLAYVKPGEVILNERQQRLLGGAATFAAVGVPGFGASVRPPVFKSYTLAGSGASISNSNDLQELKEMVYNVAAAVNAEAVKPVLLDMHSMARATNNMYKNVDIATI